MGSDEAREELSFSSAMQELETILRRVEIEEIDIDELGDELKRAAELLETCRAKIRRAEVEVSQIVQGMEQQPEAARPDEVESPAPPADSGVGEGAGETASLFDSVD